jgi:hypothetical protein
VEEGRTWVLTAVSAGERKKVRENLRVMDKVRVSDCHQLAKKGDRNYRLVARCLAGILPHSEEQI